MIEFRITLEARNPARDCFRRYHVEAGTDLFGTWLVQIAYGHIGTPGRHRTFVLAGEAEARGLVRRILRRRSTAQKRLLIPLFGEPFDPLFRTSRPHYL